MKASASSPLRACPPRLGSDWTVVALAHAVLRERFTQLSHNLKAFGRSDDPEVVHQARVGWRRFKSGLRLFKPLLPGAATPSCSRLQPLLVGLGTLRNLDVAVTQTLPALAAAYTQGDAGRGERWQSVMLALIQAAAQQRQATRRELQRPAVAANLLALAQWLDSLPSPAPSAGAGKGARRGWAKRRVGRLHQRLQLAQQEAKTLAEQHQVRILAKRLRYGVEALRDHLPKRLADDCDQQAIELQSRIGATRDLAQAANLVAQLGADEGIAQYLCGVAVGAQWAAHRGR